MPRGTPTNVSLGAGILYIGAVGVTEPTDLVSAWPAGWTQLGYTKDGSVFSYNLSTSDVEVAEELDPLLVVPTKRKISVKLALAELTASNLKRALNGGTITAGTGIVTFDPPAIGTEQRTALGFQSEDGKERWIYRKCLQTASMTVERKKAPNYSTIDAEFTLEVVSGTFPFRAIFDSTRS